LDLFAPIAFDFKHVFMKRFDAKEAISADKKQFASNLGRGLMREIGCKKGGGGRYRMEGVVDDLTVVNLLHHCAFNTHNRL
jgi:hypothetical protein